MKKVLITILSLALFAASSWAIDGAKGLGQSASKLEFGYTGGSFGVAYDYGIASDWSVYGAVTGAGGVTGFGLGTKYSFFSEQKGDSFSLAGKLELLLGGGGLFPVPGVVVSKELNKETTVLLDASSWGVAGVSVSWIGIGALYNLDPKWQLSGMIGSTNLSYSGFNASGLGIGVGVNYLL